MTGVQSRHRTSCAGGSWRRGGAAALACLAMGAIFCAHPVAAETLQEALSNAYLINPVLSSERARLRASDEQVAVAKSGLRPNISASGDAAFQNQESDIVGGSRQTTSRNAMRRPRRPSLPSAPRSPREANVGTIGDISSDGVTHPRGYSVQLSQPIFEGFQNLNAIRQAKATVQAGREGLRAVEQTTLLNAVTAYVDVVRDQAVVRLRNSNVEVLTEQLRQTKDRFNVGEVTRTDVAQAEARRSDAITQLYAAQANLKTSRATYEQIIGHPPSNLAHPPSIVHLLPSQLEDAMTLGDGQNPFILNAVYQEEASLYNVNQIMGELLPQVTLDAQYQQRFGQSNTLKEQQVTTVMGRVNVPLYQGGGVAARIRQAKETNNQLKKEVEDARLPHPRRGDLELGPAPIHRIADHVRPGCARSQPHRARRRARGGEGRPAHHARRAQRRARISRLADPARHRQARPRRGRICDLCLNWPARCTKPRFISALLRSA